jgi:hypothetical protein
MLFLTLLWEWRGWDIGFIQNFIRTQWLISPVCKWSPETSLCLTSTSEWKSLVFFSPDSLLSFRSFIHLTLLRITCPLYSKCRFRDKQWKVHEKSGMAVINDVCHKHVCCFCILICVCLCACVCVRVVYVCMYVCMYVRTYMYMYMTKQNDVMLQMKVHKNKIRKWIENTATIWK